METDITNHFDGTAYSSHKTSHNESGKANNCGRNPLNTELYVIKLSKWRRIMGEVCDMQRSNEKWSIHFSHNCEKKLNWRVILRTSYGSTVVMVVLWLNLNNRT